MIQSKTARISEVSVLELIEKPQACYSVKTVRHLCDTNNRKRFVEVQLGNANIHEVNRKPTSVGSAKLYLAHE